MILCPLHPSLTKLQSRKILGGQFGVTECYWPEYELYSSIKSFSLYLCSFYQYSLSCPSPSAISCPLSSHYLIFYVCPYLLIPGLHLFQFPQHHINTFCPEPCTSQTISCPWPSYYGKILNMHLHIFNKDCLLHNPSVGISYIFVSCVILVFI